MDDSDLLPADLAADTAMIDTALDANLDPTMDDLFGEAADPLTDAALGVTLPSLPLPPELVRHVASMQTRGCCTKLAYSNTGSIAQIADGGARIAFRAVLRDPKTGIWSLLPESKHSILPVDGAKWEHIQFNNIGVDLAAIDSQGRVYVYTLQGALGRMPLSYENIERSSYVRPDLEAVVGLHWLPMYPTEVRFPNVSPATKNGEKWSTVLQLRDSNEASLHHPADGRQALLYVSRDAKLTLMYQVDLPEGGKSVWHAVNTKLEAELNSSADLITHAAMTEDGDHLLLVTYSLSQCLRLYRININWNATQIARANGQGLMTVPDPNFTIHRLTLVDHAIPQHATAAQLSQLYFISSIPSNASIAGMPTLPTVFAIFTRAALPVDVTQQAPEAYSVISRWHVQSAVSPMLHEAFLKMNKNGPINMPTNTLTQLERQEDIFTNKILLSFESQCFNTILAFAASDGTVEFRERVTMTSIEPYPDLSTVTSLPQSGFEHVMDENFVRIAMNGDGSALAAVSPEGGMVYKLMSLRYTWDPIIDDAGLLEAAVVCLARQYTILTCTNMSNNDTLAMIPPTMSTKMRTLFVKEVIRMLRRDLDISMQDVQRQQLTATKESLLPKAMSAQLILARKPGSIEPLPGSKFATAFLNVRIAASALTVLFSRPQNSEPTLRPEFIMSLRGLVKWASDFLIYLADGLLSLRMRRELAKDRSISSLCEDFIADINTPVINLFLCSFSRAYLRFLAAGIPRYLSAVQRVMSIVRTAGERMELIEMHDYALSLPLKFNDFEAFITAIDTAIRNAYTQGSVSASRRSEIELSTITCDEQIAPELHPVLSQLVDTAFPALMEKMDLSKLRFWDTTWLGIEPSLTRQKYDVIRKVPLTKGMKLRVCRRCGAMMEDLSFEKMREWAPTVSHLGRHCICADYWMVE